jgi:MoxR-like ATPase
LPSSHAWIFQATPRTVDLAAELRGGEALSWVVTRYGRALRPGDRVYYWQAGRDAGIYGLGRVHDVSGRAADGRYTVRTAHERALFAPITRAELRADPELRGLAVLRQPRGTVFPVAPAHDAALARRTGDSVMVLAVPASRHVARTLRLCRATDGDLLDRVEGAHARGDDVDILLVADGAVTQRARVKGVRRRRDGDLDLRLMPLPGAALPSSLAPERVTQLDAGQAVQVQAPEAAPLSDDAPARPLRRVAERPGSYETAHFAPAPHEVRGDLELPASLVAELVAAVNAGRHIVLVGAPGTGKTSLALNLAQAAARAGLCAGPLLTTATADWTTFDTVGGLVPAQDGTLRFAEGVALRALRENRWLVLDELNRADIDKAFGPLLTVLSGGPVDLPTITVDGRPVRIEPSSASGLAEDGVTYRAGPGWRILATMNTLDRAALFSFSLAFARRFAFVLVPAPSPAGLLALVQRRVPLNRHAVAMLERLLQVTPRPLGPAIVLDAARYMAARADPAGLVEALGAFVLPQFEGVDQATLSAFVHDVAPALGPGGETTLRDYVRALYGEG